MTRPAPSETPRPGGLAPPLAELAGLSLAALVERFAAGVEHLDRRVLELPDDLLDTALLPAVAAAEGVGTWPARVLVGHLADAELLFVFRMRRTVAEEAPVLSVMDEQAFIDAGLYGAPGAAGEGGAEGGAPPPVAGFIAVIHTLRKWAARWLGTLSDEQWRRRALHPERGELTVRRIVEYDTWHLEHHAAILRRKIDWLLGNSK